jgi:hypothetical protein
VKGIFTAARTDSKMFWMSGRLRGDGVFVAVEGEVALGLLVFVADDAVGGGELGHHEAASAEIANEAAEDGVGDSSHGREHGGGTDFDGAEG